MSDKAKKPENNFIHVDQSRTDIQRKVMEKIADDSVCPFCIEHFKKYHKLPILKEGKFWLLTNNQWPYENVKHQFLAVYKTHIEHLSEMDPEAGKELIELFQWAAKKNNIPGGAVAIRFGSNPKLGNYGNSVLHIHAHLIEPDLENPAQETIRFKIGQPKRK